MTNFVSDLFGIMVSFLRLLPNENESQAQPEAASALLIYVPDRSSTSAVFLHCAHLMQSWPDRDQLLERMAQYHAGMSREHKQMVERGLASGKIRVAVCTTAMGLVGFNI